jgi:Winged helix-turn-helix DNA-binding
MQRPADKQPTWVFLSNHAHVLLCIARDPDSRTRDIAERVGITERAAQRIVAELIAEDYLKRTKIGRRNQYEINRHGHLRHPVFNSFEIGPLLDILNTADGTEPRPRRRGRNSEQPRAADAKRPRPA